MYNLPLTILENNDGTFTVLSNLFNIVTEGDTMQEALMNGKDALACHIEGLEKTDEEYSLLQSLSKSFSTTVTV